MRRVGAAFPFRDASRARRNGGFWRAAVRAPATKFAVLSPDSLIDSVRARGTRARGPGIVLRDVEAPETAVLLAARAQLLAALRSTTCAVEQSWSACAPYIKSAPDTRLRRVRRCRRGTPSLASAGYGIGLDTDYPILNCPQAVRPGATRSPSSRRRLPRQWCAARLRADPAARLLIIVPRLGEPTSSLGPGSLAAPGLRRTPRRSGYCSRWWRVRDRSGPAAIGLLDARGRIGSAAARGGRVRFRLAQRSTVLKLSRPGRACRAAGARCVAAANRILPCPTRDDCICCWTGRGTGRRAGGRALRRLLEALDLCPSARAGGAEGRRRRLGASLCGLAGLLRVAGHSARSDGSRFGCRFAKLLGEFAGIGVDAGTTSARIPPCIASSAGAAHPRAWPIGPALPR